MQATTLIRRVSRRAAPHLLLLLLATAPGACAHRPLPPINAVPTLDVARYMGDWYEIASLPNPYQRHCYDTKAHYALTPDGTIEVRNSCHKGSVLGPKKEAVGKAWRPDGAHPAELKVQFFWPFRGDYWVLAIDDAYSWAVVGQPSRKYLWVLARTPHLDDATYNALIRRLPGWGYDPQALHKTVHTAWVTPAPSRR